MKFRIGFAIYLVAVLSLLCGCGGNGSTGTNTSFAAFAGSYSGSFNSSAGPTVRPFSTGTLSLSVASNGQITITIVDGIEGTFCGTGIANHVGGFYITCNGIGGKQVTVNGTLKGTGLGRTASGTIAGTISVDYNAAFLHDPDTTIYANHYEGSYAQGKNSDSWFGDVSTSGAFVGQLVVTASDSTVTLKGNVYSNGSFKFAGKSGKTSYEATGNFTVAQSNGTACNGILKGKLGATTVSGAFSGHYATGG